MNPQTIESKKAPDETKVAADDEEVEADEAQDEFAGRACEPWICD